MSSKMRRWVVWEFEWMGGRLVAEFVCSLSDVHYYAVEDMAQLVASTLAD